MSDPDFYDVGSLYSDDLYLADSSRDDDANVMQRSMSMNLSTLQYELAATEDEDDVEGEAEDEAGRRVGLEHGALSGAEALAWLDRRLVGRRDDTKGLERARRRTLVYDGAGDDARVATTASGTAVWLRDRLRPRGHSAMVQLSAYIRQAWNEFVPSVLFSFVMGTVCGLVGISMEYSITWLSWCRGVMIRDIAAGDFWVGYAIWVAYALLISGFSMMISLWTPECTGGGTSELRAIMSGRIMPNVLTLRVLVSKYVGLVLTEAAGLVVGRQGPMAQICAIISYQLMRLPLFRRFHANSERRYEMIGAGISVSPAANYMVPFAGTLWGYEFSSSHATIRMFWVSFIGSLAAFFPFRLLSFRSFYIHIELPMNSWAWRDIPFYIFLGILCGLLCALQMRLIKAVAKARISLSRGGTNHPQRRFFALISRPYVYGALLVTATSVLTYPGRYKYLGQSNINLLTQMWGANTLGLGDVSAWGDPSPVFSLLFSLFILWPLFTFSALIPMSGGTFTPCLWIGALVGRLMAELMDESGIVSSSSPMNPTDISYSGFVPGSFAIVGSAAYTAAFTKTLSVSLFILEICGQYQLIGPSMLSCAAAFLTMNYFADSFYDMMCRVRGLSFVPPVPDILRNVPVGAFMSKRFGVVQMDAKEDEIVVLLKSAPQQYLFPVVIGSSMRPLGFASRRDLLTFLVYDDSGERMRENVVRLSVHFERPELRLDSWIDVLSPGLYDLKRGLMPSVFRSQFPLHHVPVIVQPQTPLTLIHHLVVRYEQPVVLVVDRDGALIGMTSREQVIHAIGERSYFRVLRGFAQRVFLLAANNSIPRSAVASNATGNPLPSRSQ